MPVTRERRETTLRIAGADLPLRTRGAGAPVLLLHGVPGDEETLEPVAEALAAGWRAMTLGQRHAGPGPHGTRPFGTAQQRDDLVGVIGALDAGPVHLVAWSYAAHAALAVAASRPDLVRSLLVYEPGFPTFVEDGDAAERIARDTAAAFGPVFEALGAGEVQEAVRRSIDAAAGRPGWFDRQPARVRAVHRRCAHQLALLGGQTPPLPLDAAALRSIRVPTTVARGAETRACYALVSDCAAGLIPLADRVSVAGANHLLPEADPAAFASLVRRHLMRAPTPS